ncbi:MAG: hypothetical protein ACFNYM_08495 [Bacteroidota bacterium]
MVDIAYVFDMLFWIFVICILAITALSGSLYLTVRVLCAGLGDSETILPARATTSTSPYDL